MIDFDRSFFVLIFCEYFFFFCFAKPDMHRSSRGALASRTFQLPLVSLPTSHLILFLLFAKKKQENTTSPLASAPT